MHDAAKSGELSSTTGSTATLWGRRNSLRPFSFGRFRLRPPEPKALGRPIQAIDLGFKIALESLLQCGGAGSDVMAAAQSCKSTCV
jgi:hypothetical protein